MASLLLNLQNKAKGTVTHPDNWKKTVFHSWLHNRASWKPLFFLRTLHETNVWNVPFRHVDRDAVDKTFLWLCLQLIVLSPVETSSNSPREEQNTKYAYRSECLQVQYNFDLFRKKKIDKCWQVGWRGLLWKGGEKVTEGRSGWRLVMTQQEFIEENDFAYLFN